MGGLKDLTIRFVVGRKDFVTKAISVDCCCNVVSISGDDGVQSICGLWPVEADVIIAAVITAVCVFFGCGLWHLAGSAKQLIITKSDNHKKPADH